MPNALSLKNLALGYRGKVVLEVEQIDIPQGRMVFVIGSSGTGKSTLLESIGLMSNTFLPGLNGPPELSIEGESFDPFDLWSGPLDRLSRIRRERFSFIFQSTNLMPNFTVGENIRMAAFDDQPKAVDIGDRINGLMDALDLPLEALEKPAHAISGGQRQRVAFIRALVKDFSILFADEPTGNLDPENAMILFGVLKNELAKQGRTAVIVTHHLGLAERFGDLILELRSAGNGRPAIIGAKRTQVPV